MQQIDPTQLSSEQKIELIGTQVFPSRAVHDDLLEFRMVGIYLVRDGRVDEQHTFVDLVDVGYASNQLGGIPSNATIETMKVNQVYPDFHFRTSVNA